MRTTEKMAQAPTTRQALTLRDITLTWEENGRPRHLTGQDLARLVALGTCTSLDEDDYYSPFNPVRIAEVLEAMAEITSDLGHVEEPYQSFPMFLSSVQRLLAHCLSAACVDADKFAASIQVETAAPAAA